MIFDDKQEVYDIQLTDYGKRMFAKGRFNPEYYSFSDESVIYDVEAAGISNEATTKAENRILNETVYIKPIVNTAGISDQNSVEFLTDLQRDQYKKITSLGTSTNSNEYIPSWDIKMGEAEISTVKSFIDENNKGVKIPQLEMEDLNYNLNIIFDVPFNLINKVISFGVPDASGVPSDESEDNIFEIDNKSLFLDINEENSFLSNNKFSLEVFIYTDRDNNEYRKLKFANNGDVNEDSNIFVPPSEDDIEITPDFVEYYFNVTTDEDIEPEVICENIPEQRRRGVYAKDRYNCEKKVIDISDDIYQNFDDNIEERCD